MSTHLKHLTTAGLARMRRKNKRLAKNNLKSGKRLSSKTLKTLELQERRAQADWANGNSGGDVGAYYRDDPGFED